MTGESDAVKEVTTAETKGSLLLWVGVLTGPLAWAAHLAIAADLAEILCYPAVQEPGTILGFDLEAFFVALTAALALVTLAALLVSFACWRRIKRSEDTSTGQRAEWMAAAGVFVNSLFLTSILIGFFPMVFLRSCVTPL